MEARTELMREIVSPRLLIVKNCVLLLWRCDFMHLRQSSLLAKSLCNKRLRFTLKFGRALRTITVKPVG
jgi:hypothetical protein